MMSIEHEPHEQEFATEENKAPNGGCIFHYYDKQINYKKLKTKIRSKMLFKKIYPVGNHWPDMSDITQLYFLDS